jgi:hypothetical protein
MNLNKILAPKPLLQQRQLRDKANIQRFEVPRGYASEMAKILRAMEKIGGAPDLEAPETAYWCRTSDILRSLRIKKADHSTFRRRLKELVSSRLIVQKNGAGSGFYQISPNAYVWRSSGEISDL